MVRVGVLWDSVADRTELTWSLMAGLVVVVVVVGFSAFLAWYLARRLTMPLESLITAARALEAGDFSVRSPRTGIREADAAGQALTATARRIREMLDRERRFSTAVSHQLRTPLTALVLGLEVAEQMDDAGRRRAVSTALRRAERLGDTVEELLRLSRETHHNHTVFDVAVLAERVAQRHRDMVVEAGRRLVVRCEAELPPVRASGAAVTQVLDTLLDNALTHGAGEIRLTVTATGDEVRLEVSDDGLGLQVHKVHNRAVFHKHRQSVRRGIGLPLARSLAEAEGGRLIVRDPGPKPVFSLLFPAYDPPLRMNAECGDGAPYDGNS